MGFPFELGATAALLIGVAVAATVLSVVASRSGSKVILTILLWLSAALTAVVLVAVVIILGRIGSVRERHIGNEASEAQVAVERGAGDVVSTAGNVPRKESQPVVPARTERKGASALAVPGVSLGQPIVIQVNPAANEAKPGGSEGSESMTAVMNAVALVVAVVTLLLSLGTTWLSTQMTRVQELTKELNVQIGVASLHEQAAEALIEAKRAMLDWVSANSSKPADQAIEWGLRLEMLTSAVPLTRFRAYDELQVLRTMPDELRVAVARYASVCDELLSQRPKIARPVSRHLSEADSRIDQGRWCRLFDDEELARYAAVIRLLHGSGK
jgi:uncharacterized membrane protein